MRRTKAPEVHDDAPPDWRVLKTLWPYLTEFPSRILLAMACLILAKGAGVMLPLLMKDLVDGLANAKAALVAVPLALLFTYGALRFANVLFGELRDLIFGRVTERAMRRAALRVFQHLHRLDLDFHLSRRTGGLSRDIERGISGISSLLRFMLFNILPTLIEIGLVAGILLFNYGLSFAVITLISVILYIAFSVIITDWRTQYVRAANRLDSNANTRAIDSLLNYETVKYFGNERYEAEQYDRVLADWERSLTQNRLSLSALNAGQAFIVAGSLTWMMILAALKVTSGEATLGDFVAINAFVMQLFIPLNFLGVVYREIRRSLIDMGRMFALLQIKPKIADRRKARELGATQVSIRFENVHFAYHERREILHGISFDIPAGRKLAIVGPSGSGKSTIARLLFRLYDVQQGGISINGTDARDLTQDSLRAHIGVVPQDTVLFNDTIFNNIQYGRPSAPREEVERAAQLAHLDAFIRHLPDGYDTMVGERGLKLSGGEKQRVAIARALLKNPTVMIFDEATSSLDSGSEQAILEAIREVAAQRTTLVIAHRLSTITDADEIILLDQGHIRERGTHEQLLAMDGAYAKLWRLQQSDKTATPSSSSG